MKRGKIERQTRRLVWLLLLTGLFFSLTDPAWAQTPTPGPDSVTTGLVTMTVQADPAKVPLDQLFTVSVTLQGDSNQCGQTEVIKPVDVFQVIDHSGSMDAENKLELAKQAAIVFLDEMNVSSDRVGVVAFDGSPDVIQPLSNDFAQIKQAIESISSGGGTDVAAGLTEAYQALKPVRRTNAVPVIIVLSDGQSSVDAISHAANTAKADGFVVVAVGLGNDVDEQAMRSMASEDIDGKPLYYFAPDPSQLNDVYRAIARAIRKYGLAANIQVQFQVDVYNYQILPDSLQPTGTIAGDTITWQQPTLDTGNTTFSFQARGRGPGEVPVGKTIFASFRECEQADKELRLDAVPVVTITQITDPPPVPRVCEPWQAFPWWALVPLLVLSLLGLLSLTPPGRRFWRKYSSKSILCKIIAWLLLLTLLLVSAFLTRALLGDLCREATVYFWKIVAGGEVGVYQARFDAQQPAPVTTLNQGSNCVACHESSSNLQLAAIRDEQNGEVMVVHKNGQSVPLPALSASYLAWSPDGQKLALSYDDADIYVLDVASGALEPLPGASEPGVVETMPTWSPDGKIIAFVRAPRTAPAPETANVRDPSDIYTIPAEGGVALPLPGASGNGFNYYPAYSPNGKWLAFTRHVDGQDTYADNAADVYIIPSQGTQNPVRLAINSEASDSWPSWSPDSKWLGFSSNRKDGQFDVLVSPIGENGLPYELLYDQQGNRSNVFKLPAASLSQDEEFHPVWVIKDEASVLQRVLALWPWLIPLLLLPLLALLVCREPKYTVEVDVIDGLTGKPISQAEVRFHRQETHE
jgi:uncharacterized protein YegL